MKKVSVIMTAFNNENTIRDAIESVLSQSYKEWELIICDDASTDSTASIVQVYVNRIPGQVKLLRNLWNCGAAYGRNHCIQHSQGDYIAILDGDDIALPQRLEIQANFLDKHPEFIIVGSNVIVFNDHLEEFCRKMPIEPTKEDFINNRVFTNSATMIRRTAVLEVQGFTVSPFTRRGQDTEFWSKLYGKGYRGYNIQNCLTKYREDTDNYTRRKVNTYWFRYLLLNLLVAKNLKLNIWQYGFVLKPVLRAFLPTPVYIFLTNPARTEQ